MENDRAGTDAAIALAMADFESLGENKLAIDKMCALMSLHAIARTCRRECLPEETIIRPIILKKIAFIKKAAGKKQLREILEPPKVRYDGGEIRPVGPYAIPEEELILWSRTSLAGPLISPAFKRYLTLFGEVFPELAKEFGI